MTFVDVSEPDRKRNDCSSHSGFPIRNACRSWAGSAIGARGSQACIIKSAPGWDACVNVIVGLIILSSLGTVSYIGRDLWPFIRLH